VTAAQWATIRNFKPREFDSPDAQGSGSRMDYSFMVRLDQVRSDVGFPLVVRSGYRTLAHNTAVGGVEESDHMSGEGSDVKALTSSTRMAIVRAALARGFVRIGIGDTFVHLGSAAHLPQRVLWLY
jgi:hypothetical protein